MDAARRWVFPILRLVLVAVVAVALCKLAFFPDRPAEDDSAIPTGEVTAPTVVVARGSIANDVVVDATVSADPAVAVKATAAGTVDEVNVVEGAVVAAGDVVYDVKVEIERDPADSVDAEGKPLPVRYRYVDVTAPISGTVSAVGIIEGQTVSVGEATAQVAPPTYSVSGTLAPAQRYRLVSAPTEAQVAITAGPAPFTCGGLRIQNPLQGAGGQGGGGGTGSDPAGGGGAPGGSGGSGGSSTTTVTCPVPDGVTVFPGLTASMTLSGGHADGVLIVPTTAVQGAAQSGTVWVVAADGTQEERAIGLGLTDGSQIEVTGGLEEGETVLQFAPGAAALVDDGMGGCISLPSGNAVCGSTP
ncbi:efflux RND transporter periplasmic adaptor subunit [Cnuibacter sp. UC19_7]|uniref:efflux RND transporter periplasmic adaptor subunit n=1 Tax=Cnuibacter sp. UC19_7 TaxID=3350166 RepID=UPI00366E6D97